MTLPIPQPLPMDDDEDSFKRLSLKALKMQIRAETQVLLGNYNGLFWLQKQFESEGPSDHPAYDETVAQLGFDPLKEG